MSPARTRRRSLCLVPLDLAGELELLGWLGPRLEPVFDTTVEIRSDSFAVPRHFDPVRNQYEAGSILAGLAAASCADWVLGVTSVDLYMPVFTFVIGEAHLDGRAGVVSTYRLHQERYGGAPDLVQLRERLYKEAVHELGHCHGLVHCLDSRCVMFSSSSVEEVDLKGAEPCDRCAAQLRARLARPG